MAVQEVAMRVVRAVMATEETVVEPTVEVGEQH